MIAVAEETLVRWLSPGSPSSSVRGTLKASTSPGPDLSLTWLSTWPLASAPGSYAPSDRLPQVPTEPFVYLSRPPSLIETATPDSSPILQETQLSPLGARPHFSFQLCPNSYPVLFLDSQFHCILKNKTTGGIKGQHRTVKDIGRGVWTPWKIEIMAGPEADAQFHFTGIKKNFNAYTLTGRMNCVLATYGSIALIVLYFKLRSKKAPAVKAT